MLSLLLKIAGYTVLFSGMLGFVLYMVELIRFSFSKKSAGPLPWWIFWRH